MKLSQRKPGLRFFQTQNHPRRIPIVLPEQLEGRRLLAAHILGNPTVYATIQSAVTAAAPGAVIRVDPGSYSELVTINKPLVLLGAQTGVDARLTSRGSTAAESTVMGADLGLGVRTTSFYITANDVTLDGFTIVNNTSSGTYGAGIVLAPLVSGTHIVNNIVTSNIAGLYLANASATDRAVIQHNLFSFNNNPGNNNGRGIYTDGGVSGGNLTNVLIDANTFTSNVGDGTSGNPEAAIGLEAQTAGKQSNITITNNVMNANGKGVLLYNLTGGLIANNVITGSTDSTSAAIRVEGNAVNLAITGNTITGNAGAAVRITDRFVGPSSGITLNNNTLSENTGGGLIVDPAAYTGALDATHNWWGSNSGPAGDGAGTGDSVLANGASVAFSPWSTTPAATLPPPAALSSRGAIDLALQSVLALGTLTTTPDTSSKLADIISDLTAAINPALWSNDSHLLPNGGQQVFDLIKDSAHKLLDLSKGKSSALSPNVVNPIADRLADVDRQIALTAVLDALRAGNPKKFIEAGLELFRGGIDEFFGNDDSAIDHFKNAWQKVQ